MKNNNKKGFKPKKKKNRQALYDYKMKLRGFTSQKKKYINERERRRERKRRRKY